MKKRLAFSAPLLAFVLAYGTSYSAIGQDRTMGGSDLGRNDGPSGRSRGVLPDPTAKNFQESAEKIAMLKRKLQEAISLKDEKILSDMKGEVKIALNVHFDRDLAIQESELARLSKRADSADSQCKQRRTARNEIIDLQLQSYLLEKNTPSLGSDSAEAQSFLNAGRKDEAQRKFSRASSQGSSDPFGSSPESQPSSDPFGSSSDGAAGQTQFNDGISNHPYQSKDMIEKAREKLAESATADEEAQATQELKGSLETYFDHDLRERERILKAVRTDLEKMKQKLEKRASSKNDIVELQFKMFVNEASGLGFFSPKVTKTADSL